MSGPVTALRLAKAVHIVRGALGAALLSIMLPAGALAGQAHPATPIAPDAPQQDHCPTASADQCGERRPVTISLRSDLGSDSARVAEMIHANPLLRIGSPAEVEIGQSPDDPHQIEIITWYPETAPDPALPASRSADGASPDAEPAPPTSPGNIVTLEPDGRDFEQKFQDAMRRLIRARAMMLHATAPAQRQYALCIEENVRPCPETGGSYLDDLRRGQAVKIGLRNEASSPQFAYLLAFAPDDSLHLILSPADLGGAALAPGALVETDPETLTLVPGVYRFFAIRSDRPLTPGFLASDPEAYDRSQCRAGLEQTLCSLLSGTNIQVPGANALAAADWRISADTLVISPHHTVRVGHGKIVPNGFAPWQVQIYSNQTYSKQQIADDRALGDNGKSLWQQQPYQRYHRCAGSLIARDIVLTAAHCVAKPPVDGLQVLGKREILVGTQDLRRGGAAYRIVAAVVHRGYTPNSQKDDIALLRIAPKSRAVAQQTIALPGDVAHFRKVGAGARMTVLGWGYTNVVTRTERHERTREGPQFAEDRLRMAEMEAIAVGSCRKRKGYGDIDRKICAISPATRTEEGNTFSCRGDSGGPVIQQLPSGIVQIGLVSGGVGCGAVENGLQNPSLFVDLAQYSAWIAAAEKRLRTLSGAVERLP